MEVKIGDMFKLQACLLQQGRKFLELVDEKLGSKVDEEEAER